MEFFNKNAHGGAAMSFAQTPRTFVSRFAIGFFVFGMACPVLSRAEQPAEAPAAPAEAAQPAIDNAQNTVGGLINANAVFVRCGAADSSYPTMRLDKGARVNVVGMKADWLKIVPPDGSFCVILKAYVDRTGDGSSGKVNKDSVNVRAGSTLNTLKVQVACQLGIGDEVKILGEQDEYYKIVPPTGKAFAYVKKQFVDPDPTSTPTPQNPPAVVHNDAPKGSDPLSIPDNKTTSPTEQTLVQPTPGEVARNTNPPATTQQVADATPTSKPSDPAALVGAQFDEAEASYAAANGKPVDQQPIADLLKQYQSLVASDQLPSTLHRLAETRVSTLKLRAQAAEQLASAKAAQESMAKKEQALQAERKELEERGQNLDVATYTAIGALETSSLQLGSKVLYRLTDPANGRTVCYIRTDDSKFVNFLGKFVGVKGELTTESQLSMKVVTPSDVAQVDESKVNHGVTATIIPPSMMAPDDASAAAHVDTQK
jgi:uncharacterized protein YgiM (DUF1202 family)